MQLTVFTPTYNREKLLTRVYKSLINQTNQDFEWLIVDDGSTDETQQEVERWIEDNRITIRYYKRENGGKMRAHNLGVELANAPLFVCLDSDDYFSSTAVDELLKCYNTAICDYKGDKPIGGVVAHKGKSETELLSDYDFPIGGYSTLYNLYLQGFKGETTLMYETDVLRKYPFPEIDGEKYVPEDYIYDKIDDVCVLAILPSIITVCEIVNEGYTDSVSRLKRDNPIAWYLYYEQRAYITPLSILKIKYLGRYIIYSKRAGYSIKDNARINIIYKCLGYMMAAFLTIIRKE